MSQQSLEAVVTSVYWHLLIFTHKAFRVTVPQTNLENSAISLNHAVTPISFNAVTVENAFIEACFVMEIMIVQIDPMNKTVTALNHTVNPISFNAAMESAFLNTGFVTVMMIVGIDQMNNIATALDSVGAMSSNATTAPVYVRAGVVMATRIVKTGRMSGIVTHQALLLPNARTTSINVRTALVYIRAGVVMVRKIVMTSRMS